MNQIEKARAIVSVCRAVIQTVREAGKTPAGTIYAALMAQGCSLQQYEQIERLIIETGQIRKSGDLLEYIGQN